MMKVEYTPSVERSISGLNGEERRKIHAWFDYLGHWDEEEAIRQNSLPLPGHPGVYLLVTTTELRFFYRIDGDTIQIVNVATRLMWPAEIAFDAGRERSGLPAELPDGLQQRGRFARRALGVQRLADSA